MAQFVIFDTEYASWDGFLTAPEAEKKKAEIVQIAALKVEAGSFIVIEELNLYVKPRFEPKLTDYFVKLTGLTDELLAHEGNSFDMAYEKFKRFAGTLPCYSHNWLDMEDRISDGKIMGYNLELWHIIDTNEPDYRNIAPWFKQQYEKKEIAIARQSSGEIAKLLGCTDNLPAGLDTHNALYDVYSILAGLKKLKFRF